MIHVVKPKEAKHRNSFGVSFDLLAIGPQSMVTKMRYRKDNVIPFHSHPNEQSGYILSGRIRVLTRDAGHELGPGDTYAIPPMWSTALRSSSRHRRSRCSRYRGKTSANCALCSVFATVRVGPRNGY